MGNRIALILGIWVLLGADCRFAQPVPVTEKTFVAANNLRIKVKEVAFGGEPSLVPVVWSAYHSSTARAARPALIRLARPSQIRRATVAPATFSRQREKGQARRQRRTAPAIFSNVPSLASERGWPARIMRWLHA